MAEQSWWRRAQAAVNREYERRIRRASQVTEYGAHIQHGHEDDDGEAAAIMNVPRGTRIAPPTPPAPVESPPPATSDVER